MIINYIILMLIKKTNKNYSEHFFINLFIKLQIKETKGQIKKKALTVEKTPNPNKQRATFNLSMLFFKDFL